jgi:hypothetical protein
MVMVMTSPQRTKHEILLLGGIVLIGLITWLAVIPLATTIFNQQQQQSNNQAIPPLPLIKPPVYTSCSHNQTAGYLDRGIICLPQDQKLMEKYLDRQHRQI